MWAEEIRMILDRATNIEDIIKDGNQFFPDMIKFCIDRKRRKVIIDEEMHIDMEHELYDDGSEYEDIFGGNIMIDREPYEVIWEGHPNIERNKKLGGRGRVITDEDVISDLSEILYEWVK